MQHLELLNYLQDDRNCTGNATATIKTIEFNSVKSKTYFIIFLLILLLNCCGSHKTISKIYTIESCSDKFQIVSFESILDSVSTYDGHFVEISGYYRSGFEESAIYDFKTERKFELAIWTDFAPSLEEMVVKDSDHEFAKMNGKKIKVRGKVQAAKGGHLNQYGATLEFICYLEVFD